MFRLILIAILAAFIVFILFSLDQARYLDFSGLTDRFRCLHLRPGAIYFTYQNRQNPSG